LTYKLDGNGCREELGERIVSTMYNLSISLRERRRRRNRQTPMPDVRAPTSSAGSGSINFGLQFSAAAHEFGGSKIRWPPALS